MKTNTAWLLRILVVPFCLWGLSGFAGDRVALVVGNNDYSEDGNFPDLTNCISDARLLKSTLKAVGFEVILVENATLSEMDDALLSFEGKIEKGSTALVYFAGHGIEYNGQNYLMASNAELKARSRLSEEALKAETFASAMILAGAKSSFLLLDCCRDVPGDSGWATRGRKKQGLAQIDIAGDIIIGFAATPGKAALEPGVEGENSPYAKALAKWIPEGLDHRDVFDEVRREVHQATGGLQRTWESGSFLYPFFFSESEKLASVSSVEIQKLREELEVLRSTSATMLGAKSGGYAKGIESVSSADVSGVSKRIQLSAEGDDSPLLGGILMSEEGGIVLAPVGKLSEDALSTDEPGAADVSTGTNLILRSGVFEYDPLTGAIPVKAILMEKEYPVPLLRPIGEEGAEVDWKSDQIGGTD